MEISNKPSISGDAAVHFVAGELLKKGYIALQTLRNTQGIDMILTKPNDFSKTTYLQVKSNRNKFDFWLTGEPITGDNVFYVFVNLLTNQGNVRPEYYIVPSADVYYKYSKFEEAKKQTNPTTAQTEEVVRLIKEKKSAYAIMEAVGVSVVAIRRIAKKNDLKIYYSRKKSKLSTGVNFAFGFSIRNSKTDYKDNWESLFRSLS